MSTTMRRVCQQCQMDFAGPGPGAEGQPGEVPCPRCGAAVPPGSPPTAAPAKASSAGPPQIGGYRLGRLVEETESAVTYQARGPDDGLVVVKVLKPHLTSSLSFRVSFFEEAQAIAQLEHENILRLLSYGEDHGRWYLVSEHAGASLRALLETCGRLPTEVAATIAAQMLVGLAAAHGWGVLHRNLNPANVILSRAGLVKLADFSVAASPAAAQTVIGVRPTPYVSPEQLGGDAADARSDLYGVGAIFHEMLAGGPPAQATGPTAISHDVTPEGLAAVEDVPPRLLAIVNRLLEARPEERYQTATDALDDLRPFLEPVLAKEPHLLRDFLRAPDAIQARPGPGGPSGTIPLAAARPPVAGGPPPSATAASYSVPTLFRAEDVEPPSAAWIFFSTWGWKILVAGGVIAGVVYLLTRLGGSVDAKQEKFTKKMEMLGDAMEQIRDQQAVAQGMLKKFNQLRRNRFGSPQEYMRAAAKLRETARRSAQKGMDLMRRLLAKMPEDVRKRMFQQNPRVRQAMDAMNAFMRRHGGGGSARALLGLGGEPSAGTPVAPPSTNRGPTETTQFLDNLIRQRKARFAKAKKLFAKAEAAVKTSELDKAKRLYESVMSHTYASDSLHQTAKQQRDLVVRRLLDRPPLPPPLPPQ